MPSPAFPPPGATDCHVHVIGPKPRFPLAPARSYTPMDAPSEALAAMLARLKLDRVVLVQPSFYRTDNACMLDAMAKLKNTRGVAVLPDKVAAAELDRQQEQGIPGLRVNNATAGTASLDAMRRDIAAAARLCERHGWHVQLFVPSTAIEPLAPVLTALPVDSVIDHFGLIAPGADTPSSRALLRLLEGGKTWVKISGAYRITINWRDPRIGPLARTLCAANPQRIVWGSDWPHTPKHSQRKPNAEQELPFQAIDTAGLLALVPHWLESDRLMRRVMVSNPKKLYDFT
ncbi:MAG: amidohydrolase family protein [Rhizobiales bacterium]|nr:amidohydrolase family protein [Hyphomicrobiales bacterium]